MLNLYRAFLDLIPSPALEVGVVESVAHSVAVKTIGTDSVSFDAVTSTLEGT